MRNNASHASAAIREDFAVLEAAQFKMHLELQHFQTSVTKQLGSVAKTLQKLSVEHAAQEKQFQAQQESMTSIGGNRYRAQSASVNGNPGPPPSEYTLTSPPGTSNRNRAQSASVSGHLGRDSILSQSGTRERSSSSIRESLVAPPASFLSPTAQAQSRTLNSAERERSEPRPVNAINHEPFPVSPKITPRRNNPRRRLESDEDSTDDERFGTAAQLRINSRRSSNVSASSDGGLSTSGNGPVGNRRMSRPAVRSNLGGNLY